MSIFDHALIISMLGMFVFGVAHNKVPYQFFLSVFFISALAAVIERHGFEGLVWVPLVLIGFFVSVWIFVNVITTALWKSASRGTEDEGSPAPVSLKVPEFIKTISGANW